MTTYLKLSVVRSSILTVHFTHDYIGDGGDEGDDDDMWCSVVEVMVMEVMSELSMMIMLVVMVMMRKYGVVWLIVVMEVEAARVGLLGYH